MTKEEASKKYYDLVEQCKIEDVDCMKYNYHHIEPLFELKEKLGIETTKEIRGSKFDDGELLKCSVFHHIMLHYYLCFMFKRKTRLFYNAKHAFCRTMGIKNQDNITFTEDEVKKLAEMKESVAKTNVKDEDIKLRKNRLCYDPRFDMNNDEIDYFVGRYVRYGTLFAWIKWQKEQEHNSKYANITSCQFCNKYLILDEEGNTIQFDERMNDEYREEYDKKLKERQKKNAREGARRRRQENENIKLKERDNRNKLRHRLCKDPRFNKLTRDSGHRPYEEYTTYYNLYDWATFKLKSDFITDEEKAILGDFNKAEDFAKVYLITDENGNYIYTEPKGIIGWKSNEEQSKTKFNRKNKLCFDPRIHTKTRIVKFQVLYNSLFGYKNFEKLYNSKPLDFAKSCIITDENGNYIYDNDEALIRLNKIGDENFPHLVINKSSQYDTTNTIFEM